MQHLDALLESFEQSDTRIVSRQHSRRAGRLHEQGNELGERPIHSLRQRLHDDHVRVAVDNERRQQVGFAVHQPERCRIDGQTLAIGDRGLDPPLPERRVDLLILAREHAQRDLRLVAVQPAPKRPLPRPEDLDDFARRGRRIRNVRAIDPWVALTNPGFAARRHNHSRD